VTVPSMDGSIFWMEHPDWFDVILRIRVIPIGPASGLFELGLGLGLGVYLVAERLDRAVDCLHLPNGSIRRIGGDD